MIWLSIYLVGAVCTYAYYYDPVCTRVFETEKLLAAAVWPIIPPLLLFHWFMFDD